ARRNEAPRMPRRCGVRPRRWGACETVRTLDVWRPLDFKLTLTCSLSRVTMRGIVTGASRGLGLALTRALSERGWQLAVDARGAQALENAVAGLAGVVAIAG